jgi:small subunit ribosomal protein S18
MAKVPTSEQMEIQGVRIGVPRRAFLKSRRFCRFCRERVEFIDYKDLELLAQWVTERGRIPPRRINGNCARHQKQLATAIKRARIMAILPFVVQ